ncbi:MAG: hypothetical protein HND58_17375 [Planctomycetota bacterium]|nr:MAG: hypothetical protein HND58_17375 [Planctomycetota bacterium]
MTTPPSTTPIPRLVLVALLTLGLALLAYFIFGMPVGRPEVGLILLIGGVFALSHLVVVTRRRIRARAGRCPNCGCDLRDGDGVCPNCADHT